MRIASAKTKLDLYNKRYNIYLTALDYYQAIWHESYEVMKEKSILLTKSYRESQFLFKQVDGVYATLGNIQQNGATIVFYEKYKYDSENGLTADRFDLDTLHESSGKARTEFEKNLKLLEQQIGKYIKFQNINGWVFFDAQDLSHFRAAKDFVARCLVTWSRGVMTKILNK